MGALCYGHLDFSSFSCTVLMVVLYNSVYFDIADAGCKERQFYNLPFGQAVASMY